MTLFRDRKQKLENFFREKDSQHTAVSIIKQSLSTMMLEIFYFYRIKYIIGHSCTKLQLVETLQISCAHYEHHRKWKKPTATHWKSCWFCKNHFYINYIHCTLTIYLCKTSAASDGLLINNSAKILFQPCAIKYIKWCFWKADRLKTKMFSFNFSQEKISSGNTALSAKPVIPP